MKKNRKLKRKKQRLHNQKFGSFNTKGPKIKGISSLDRKLDDASDAISNQIKSTWEEYGVCRLNVQNSKGFTKLSYSQRLDSEMFLKYGNQKRFFHITSPYNWNKIKNEGLKSIDVRKNTSFSQIGNIYTIQTTDKDVWNFVSYNQLALGVNGLKMIVIEISEEGITGNMYSEEGGEYTTPLHTLIEQKIINPQFLNKVYEFETNRLQFYQFRPVIQKLKNEFLLKKFQEIERMTDYSFDFKNVA